MALALSRKALFASTMALALGVGVSALAFQVPGQPPADPPPTPPPADPTPPRPDDPRERPAVTHTGTVVDLFSYLEKTDKHERRMRDRRPDAPGAPRAPGAPAPRGPGGGNGEGEEGIDWAAGDYADNIKAGVPIVLMIEDERPWGPTEARPHVVAFDPDDSLSRSAFEELKNNPGKEVEVTGEIRKDGAMRGLRVIVLKEIR